MEDSVKADCSITSQALYQQYLMEKLGNFINPGNGDLDYQIEYIIAGKDNDEANLKAVAEEQAFARERRNQCGRPYGGPCESGTGDICRSGYSSQFSYSSGSWRDRKVH